MTQKGRPGLVSETEPMGAVVLAYQAEGFGDVHRAIAKNLRKALPDVKIVFARSRAAVANGETYNLPGGINVDVPLDSPWARDFAPVWVRAPDGKWEVVQFEYRNSYEDKFGGAADDFAPLLAKKLNVRLVSSRLQLEPGNLMALGDRLYVTDKVVKANTPKWAKLSGVEFAKVRSSSEYKTRRDEIADNLKSILRMSEVAWLEPLPYEDTGHCDMFVREGKGDVVFVSQMPSVAEFEARGSTLSANAKQVIQSQVDSLERTAQRFKGKKVVRLKNALAPTPGGERPSEVRSYANALVVNDVAFVPQYYNKEERGAESVKKSDAAALKAYADVGFKAVYGIDASAINKFKGSVHCASQTIPAGIDLAPLKGLELKS